MTPDEKQVVETFAFRHANRSLVDHVLGDDIFEKVSRQLLTRLEKDYFIYLADMEEKELCAVQNASPTPFARIKIRRLLKNIREARTILKK